MTPTLRPTTAQQPWLEALNALIDNKKSSESQGHHWRSITSYCERHQSSTMDQGAGNKRAENDAEVAAPFVVVLHSV